MPTATEHAAMLARLLPQGPAWLTSDETDGENMWTKLLRAFSHEPARVDEAALLLLEQIIPDNENTDLDAWERIVGVPEENLTDAERLSRIQAHVYGRRKVNRAYLEGVIQAMSGNPTARLYHRTGPRCAAGVSNVGDRLRVGEWNYTYLVELMRNILAVAEDEYFSWTGFVTVTDDAADSPVTLLQTAAVVELGATHATTSLSETVNGDTVYSSIWVRNASSAPVDFEMSYLKRDNTGSTPQISTLQGELQHPIWHKITYEAGIGSGATSPRLRIRCPDGTADLELSWTVAGVRNAGLQERIHALMPIHTRGHFGVYGEYATILSHEDQLLVLW